MDNSLINLIMQPLKYSTIINFIITPEMLTKRIGIYFFFLNDFLKNLSLTK